MEFIWLVMLAIMQLQPLITFMIIIIKSYFKSVSRQLNFNLVVCGSKPMLVGLFNFRDVYFQFGISIFTGNDYLALLRRMIRALNIICSVHI